MNAVACAPRDKASVAVTVMASFRMEADAIAHGTTLNRLSRPITGGKGMGSAQAAPEGVPTP